MKLKLIRLSLAGCMTIVGLAGDSWKTSLVSEEEPGLSLMVSGKVVGPNGAAIPGAQIYVYQTDAKGLYRPDGQNANEAPPRLRGTMIANSEGRFEFRTIRPGGYPGGRNPEHIHYRVSAPSFSQLRGEILFEDDTRLTRSTRRMATARGWPIVALKAETAGILRCEVKLQLRRE